MVISKPDASLLDAAQLMKNHHVGHVVVVGDTNGPRMLSEELADLAKLVVREQDRERLPAQPRT